MGITPQKCLKPQIPYHLLQDEWLLGTTNGNQGQTMMDHLSSENINHSKWV